MRAYSPKWGLLAPSLFLIVMSAVSFADSLIHNNNEARIGAFVYAVGGVGFLLVGTLLWVVANKYLFTPTVHLEGGKIAIVVGVFEAAAFWSLFVYLKPNTPEFQIGFVVSYAVLVLALPYLAGRKTASLKQS